MRLWLHSVCVLALLLFISSPAIAQTGLVAAYSFDDGSGSVAADASGKGNTGTLLGAAWTPSGKYGGALTFNGSSNWVTVNHAAVLSLTTGMTLEAWVLTSSPTNWRSVIMKERSGGLSYALYAGDQTGRTAGYIRRTSDINATATSALPVNTWVHVATTYDGATLRTFVNGTQVATRAITGSIVTSTSPLRIGGNSVWGEYFSGTIDEVRVYNVALTAAQIQADMSTPIGNAPPPPPPPTYSIGGAITPGTDGAGSTVTLGGAASATVTADSNGTYTFAGLSNGAYTVTPTRAGFTMNPSSRSVTVNGANVTGVNFSATPITTGDTQPPTVAVTAPVAGSTVSATVAVTADASDNVGVQWVQFQLDGADLGSRVTASPYSINWNTASASDGGHTLRAIASDAAGNTATSAGIAVTVTNAPNASTVGQWGTPFDVGTVSVNMVMLHTGKVLMYSGSYQVTAAERVWDPATGSMTLVPNPYYNLFCGGQAQLPDGRILVAGGYDSSSLGAANANIFDPVAMSWTALPNMAYRRWYPTVTALPDGKMLVTSGGQTCLSCLADVPEIFDPTTNRFSQLTSARLGIWYYPFMFVLPDGRLLSAGSNERAYETRALDLNSGTWSMVDPVVKDGHSAVMYRPGKILKTGTAADSGTVGNAAPTAYVLDMTQPSPAWRQVASMRYARAFQNSTVLPDGNVLVTGGGTALDGYDVSKGVLTAELWSPATETWQTLSTATYARLYHSTTLLLPDGRVLIAGSGDDGPAVNQTRAEIFSPPYLFKGPRPSITTAPTLAQYGSSFAVQTPDAASIASVALIRPGSVTHAFDEDQRFLNLAFTADSGGLTVQAPANANLAPPGYYMLFLVNSSGIPSTAAFVRLPAPAGDTEAPTAPANLTGQGGIGSVSLAWNASTDNTGVAIYNIHRSTSSGFVPSAANRIGQTTATSYDAAGVAAGDYFFVVTAQDIAGNVSNPSNELAISVVGDTTPPTVSITSPADQTTVSGGITINASAGDNVGVAGVQFQLDSAPLGTERTSAPYSLSWNSATTTNGTHVIGAVARDAAGNKTTATVSVTVSNTAQIPPGLVAAYGFNEGAGTQVTDSSGFTNNGSIVGATWSTSGHTGSALSFNGTNASVSIPDSNSLDLTSGMTLEAWVRPTAGTGWRTVVLKEAGSNLSYALYAANGASRPVGWINNPADFSVTGTAAVALNTWTHLAVTYDGSSFRLYTNGVLVRTTSNVTAIRPSTNVLRIGGNAIWGEYFQGLIDDVRVYNRALTASEIQTDMNAGIQ